MSFLQAEWRKLAIANYEVDCSLLTPYLPFGTELDLWNGKCYVSLVGFMFLNTRLLNCKIPFHVNFEEVNLRFYVKRRENNVWKRGVVFLKEIVPKPALTFVANTVYGEKYETLPMRHTWQETEDNRLVAYSWKKKSTWHTLQVRARKNATEILPQTKPEFITEHYWGYAKINDTKTNEYEVTHPRWQHYEVVDYNIHVDFGAVYGPSFNFLTAQTPASVMLAEGSQITVENKKTIKKASSPNALAK